MTSTYTQQDGTFKLANIPTGTYEVVADSDNSEVSDQVWLQTGHPNVELRFPAREAAQTTLEPTVSVARMLVPSKAQKMYKKAFTAFHAGKYDEAQKQLDGALQIDPDFADALTLRGVIELENDVSSARQALEHAVEIDPCEGAAYIALAAVYNHEGRFDDAMRASEKGLSLSPRAWQAYLEMAKASIAQSMYMRGLKLVRQAERLGGNAYAEAHLIKAYALLPMKLYKDAKYELQASLTRQHQGQVADQAHHMLARVNALEGVGTAQGN